MKETDEYVKEFVQHYLSRVGTVDKILINYMGDFIKAMHNNPNSLYILDDMEDVALMTLAHKLRSLADEIEGGRTALNTAKSILD